MHDAIIIIERPIFIAMKSIPLLIIVRELHLAIPRIPFLLTIK